MTDWFEWNGKKCTDFGIHVSKHPPITLPAERSTFTNVPGRSGSLTVLEDEDVYDDMLLTCTCFIEHTDRLLEIAAWLRGSGTVTFRIGMAIARSRSSRRNLRIRLILICYLFSMISNMEKAAV